MPCCDHDDTADDHDSAIEHSHSPVEPCKCRFEQQSEHSYLPSPKTRIDVANENASLQLAATITMLTHDGQPVPTSQWTILDGGAGAEPPLRLHLMHQLLLI